MNISLFWQKIFFVTLGIVGVSWAAIFIRLCQQEVAQVTIGLSLLIAASRLLISTLILSPTYVNLKNIRADSSPKAIFAAVGAGICLAFHFAGWISSLNFTSVAASVSLVTTNPLWVALLSWWFLGQKITRKTFVGITIAIFGSILVAFSDPDMTTGSNPVLGALLALLGSWFASGYILLGKIAQEKNLTTSQYVSIAYLTATVCLFPLPLLMGNSYLNYSPAFYLYVFLMAIVSQIIGHTSINWCLKHFSPTTISILILIEPIISSLLAWWLFQEIPTDLVIGGSLIVIIGVLISIVNFNFKMSWKK